MIEVEMATFVDQCVVTDKLTTAVVAKIILFFCPIFCHFSLFLHFGNEDSGVLLLLAFHKNTLFLLIVNLLDQRAFYSTTNYFNPANLENLTKNPGSDKNLPHNHHPIRCHAHL